MSLLEKYSKEAATFLKVCHKLSKLMYVTGHGGNAEGSFRLRDCAARGDAEGAAVL